MYVYVCMFVCIYTCVCVYMCVRVYVYDSFLLLGTGTIFPCHIFLSSSIASETQIPPLNFTSEPDKVDVHLGSPSLTA